jgi:hypothetical protein
MINVDRSGDIRLVTDTPHRADNITDAVAHIRANAPVDDKNATLMQVIRVRRMDRAMIAHRSN